MSERPDLDRLRGIAEESSDVDDLAGSLRGLCDYADGLEQEYADYAEHTAASHRYMVDDVDRLERELGAARERMSVLETGIDNLFRVEAIDVYPDGTLGISSTAKLMDAIVDLMNARVPAAGDSAAERAGRGGE